MLMGTRLVPPGGFGGSRGSWGFWSSAIEFSRSAGGGRGAKKSRAGSAGLFAYFSGSGMDLARQIAGNKALFCMNLWGDFNSGRGADGETRVESGSCG